MRSSIHPINYGAQFTNTKGFKMPWASKSNSKDLNKKITGKQRQRLLAVCRKLQPYSLNKYEDAIVNKCLKSGKISWSTAIVIKKIAMKYFQVMAPSNWYSTFGTRD